MAGNAIVVFLAKYNWAKYILFANTNLEQYTNNSSPMFEGMTLTFSIVVLLVYLVLFLLTTWITFSKRDIAGQ
jgi:ABC-2 type transport system permease protein